jgi:hypothetical protein
MKVSKMGLLALKTQAFDMIQQLDATVQEEFAC